MNLSLISGTIRPAKVLDTIIASVDNNFSRVSFAYLMESFEIYSPIYLPNHLMISESKLL